MQKSLSILHLTFPRYCICLALSLRIPGYIAISDKRIKRFLHKSIPVKALWDFIFQVYIQNFLIFLQSYQKGENILVEDLSESCSMLIISISDFAETESCDPRSGGGCKMKRFVYQQNNLLIQYRGKLFNIYSGDRCRCKHSKQSTPRRKYQIKHHINILYQ